MDKKGLIAISVLFLCSLCSKASAFRAPSASTASRPKSSLRMSLDPHTTMQAINHLNTMHGVLPDLLSNTYMGTSGTAGLEQHFGDVDWTTLDLAASPICPKFGEPGWGPLCFLNGNPVFNTFDKFQAFMQDTLSNFAGFVGNTGVKNPYGPSIILFTLIIRAILLPLNYKQIQSSQATTALSPKVKEIKEKFPDDKDMQNQLTALLYDKADTNPLAGCLPALVQLPIFIALYRSFLNLALKNEMNEPFLWLPNLSGPVFGERSTDWILGTNAWVDGVPKLGWHDTLCYLTIPLILVVVQSISFSILSPPSDDPQVEKTQRIFKYLPLLIGYFSLSVPSGLGVYWVTQNILSTVATTGIKEYFKANPLSAGDISVDELAAQFNSAYYNPTWGYLSKSQIVEEARINDRPDRSPIIPADFA